MSTVIAVVKKKRRRKMRRRTVKKRMKTVKKRMKKTVGKAMKRRKVKMTWTLVLPYRMMRISPSDYYKADVHCSEKSYIMYCYSSSQKIKLKGQGNIFLYD